MAGGEGGGFGGYFPDRDAIYCQNLLCQRLLQHTAATLNSSVVSKFAAHLRNCCQQ